MAKRKILPSSRIWAYCVDCKHRRTTNDTANNKADRIHGWRCYVRRSANTVFRFADRPKTEPLRCTSRKIPICFKFKRSIIRKG